MEQRYLQSLINLAKKELESYKLDVEDFGLINTLFIKKILDKNNTNVFIQLEDSKKLYLPVVMASFLLMYEKNHLRNIETEFEINDRIYWVPQNKTYLVTGKDTEHYELTYEYDDKNKYGQVEHEKQTCHPRIIDCRNDYIKVNREFHRKHSFEKLLEFLPNHLKIKKLLAELPYKIAIVCHKQELINDLRNTDWYKVIPYRCLTRDGKKEDNLPIDSLIYIASDYQTIREHIFDKREKLEAVIFFDKYNDSEIISKDIRQGQLKRGIFIGEDDLQFKPNNLLKWRWSPEECRYFYPAGSPIAEVTPIYVENPELLNAINKFITGIEEIEKQLTVHLYSLKYYAIKTLHTVIPESDSISQTIFLQENFAIACDEVLFDELCAADVEKKDIDDRTKIFQDNYQDLIIQIQFSNNAKAKKLATLNFDYLIVLAEDKDIWQKISTKNVLTYGEWRRNKEKNKNVLFLGLYGYSHYQTMKNSFDNISILIYSNSQEQKAFDFYQNKYSCELEDEYHSENRVSLSGKSYPIPKKERSTPLFPEDIFDPIGNHQREETFLKYIFNDKTSEIIPISRHVLLKLGESLISEKLENVKVGDEIGNYHNFNKDKLEAIATTAQKKDILECKKCSELWKKLLIKFYRSNNYTNEENLLADLQNKGADISHINTLNKWLDMDDKSLFPSKAKNIKAIGELINDNEFNLKEISKKRKSYRSIMIALGRDFSDAISRYITNKERTDLLKNFSDDQIQKMLKENIPFKKVAKIVKPNSKERFEQED